MFRVPPVPALNISLIKTVVPEPAIDRLPDASVVRSVYTVPSV